MDGILVDGEPLHFAAVNELLGEEGLSISLDAYKPYMGTKTGWRDMMRDYGLNKPPEHYSDRYRTLIEGHYRDQGTALPGAIETVRELRRRRIPTAVASSSILPWVEACLGRLGLAGQFDVVVTGSDVQNGKPDPEIYLLTAKKLDAAPAVCLAFEDAPAGIASAKAAGMTCWAVRTEYTRGLDLGAPDRTYESLIDVDLDEIVKVAA